MNRQFNAVKMSRGKSNAFDLSHERKFSMNPGNITPFYVEEIIPGDNFKVKSEILMRFAPLASPVMHRINVFTHYFFVPFRQIMDGWEDFITGGEDGLDTTVLPQMYINATHRLKYAYGTLADYLGYPTIKSGQPCAGATLVSALRFRAYQKIYNEYYRAQSLEAEVSFATTNGIIATGDADNTTLTTMRTRSYEHDYFTSALPNAQKGGAVYLPIESEFSPQYADPAYFETLTGPSGDENLVVNASEEIENSVSGETGIVRNLDDPQVVDSTSVTVNDLRVAVKLQQWMEKNARAGSRYVESLLAHFGVHLGDYRAQRAIYLGGNRQPVVISEVLASTEGTNQELGSMAGHGISVGGRNGFKYKFREHGVVIGLMSVMPRTAYSQMLDRHLVKTDKLDYFWKEFAHLGEQAVLNQEVYWDKDDTTGTNIDEWGYQSRYSEYKFKHSTVHGDFKDTLDYWHWGRKFTSLPNLNTAFVQFDNDDRIFAVEDSWATQKLYVQVFNNVKAIRQMPIFGTPTF